MNCLHTVSRRALLLGGAAAPMALLGATQSFAASADAPIVLVHGAWHGGWCWRKLLSVLRKAGRETFAPTLTGLGERSHSLNAEIDLSTHISDVAAVLEYEDLNGVVLVGHSYGGMVISGVAEKAGPRLSHLVYLDAFVPEDGKALQDYAPVLRTRADGWRIPVPNGPRGFGVTDEDDIAWVQSRLGDQPIRTFTQPIALSSQILIPKTYIQCSEAPFFKEAAKRAKEKGFRYHDLLSAGHDAMITRPEDLAQILLQI